METWEGVRHTCGEIRAVRACVRAGRLRAGDRLSNSGFMQPSLESPPVCLAAFQIHLSHSFSSRSLHRSLSLLKSEQVTAGISIALALAPSLRGLQNAGRFACLSQGNHFTVQLSSFYSGGFPGATARHASLQRNHVAKLTEPS